MASAPKSIYFASDFHLGVPNHAASREREDRIVKWLDEIKDDAEEIFLVGDLFDFWFEYKTVIPKGFVRLQGKIAALCDSGIPIHVFTGNHDMWMFGYLEKELGVTIHYSPIQREFFGKKVFIGHGDGLGPGDHGYKFIKKVFANRFFQWCFARLHPNFGIGIADYLSRRSRAKTGNSEDEYLGDEKEFLVQYCQEMAAKYPIDYFIFGHRHLPIEKKINETIIYINLGDWIRYQTYAKLTPDGIFLLKFEE
ncbi:MAG: UDP-2,3-diacylglucosamine diphosphatase [Crocinitomicaceae bacterium]|nr:UDP-2,3-diacylglucosamine diphosphatase [Crocinitomicaceae bacterium]